MADRMLTDLELERWIADDLPEPRRQTATAADRARLEALRAEHAAWLATVDVPAELRAIQQRTDLSARPARWRWTTWTIASGALAAAAVVAVVSLRGPAVVEDSDLRSKGDSVSFAIHVATPSGSSRLASGDTVHAGDRIRFELHVPDRGYVAVVGIDGTGASTVYYPFGATSPILIEPKAGGVLQGAIALDDAPGDERFYALYALWSFPLDTGLAARLRSGASPQDVQVAEIVLHKRPR